MGCPCEMSNRHNTGMTDRIVYSTGIGSLCPNCRRPVRECVCPKGAPGAAKPTAVRVGREIKGRAGKGVTTVSGLPLSLSDIESLGHPAQEALRMRRHRARRGHRNSGRSSRRDRCGAGQTGMAGEEIGRLGGHAECSRAAGAQLVYHAAIAIRAVWRESLRTGPPKAQPPGNAQAHERQTLAISGERSRCQAAIHRRGVALTQRARSLRSKGQRGKARRCLCLYVLSP